MQRFARLAGVFALVGVFGCATAKQVVGMRDTVTGVVTDRQEQTVEVRNSETQQTAWFQRTPETVLVRENQPMDWSELEEGMPVRVSYEPEAGAERAVRVEVLTGAEAEKVHEALPE